MLDLLAGHTEEFDAQPAAFVLRAWRECGGVAELDPGGVRNVLRSSEPCRLRHQCREARPR